MKLLPITAILATLTISFSSFAGSSAAKISEINPHIQDCRGGELASIPAPIQNNVKTISKDINVFNLVSPVGDPAVWSSLYSVGLSFPFDGGQDQTCIVINQASLSDMSLVKLVSYDAKLGRLIEIPVTIATFNNDTYEFGDRKKTLKVRINQISGKATLE